MNIHDYLKQFTGNDIVYHANPGNAGDSLIATSTYQLFEDLGLEYCLYDTESGLPDNAVLVYGGGGNLVDGYSHASNFINRNKNRAEKIVLLPHTINSNEQFLADLQQNITLITREETSYRHAKKFAKNAEVLLMNDLAFSLDTPRFLALPTPPWNGIFTPQLPWRSRRRILKSTLYHTHQINLVRAKQRSPVLSAFRRDQEASNFKIPHHNFDLSQIFAFGTFSRTTNDLSSRMFLKTINLFDTIRTNRLHIAIAGCLLEKHVEFYANNYYKNKAVFDYSMRPNFDNIKWIDT